MDINRIIEIAEDLGIKDLSAQLHLLSKKVTDSDCPLILPLVGEFSSGKTTLINSLTDSKQLETAIKPTTATIYEVHFGCELCNASVLDSNEVIQNVVDIADLKNDQLADAKVVTVRDTSTRVPSSIVLVDTPGLSSPDPRHKQTLVEFLPQADGILLVVEINSQLTRSTIDFINSMELAKRPIYLVMTKCETKTESDILASKKTMQQNTGIPMERIVAVSSYKDNLKELAELFSKIQNEKGKILNEVNKLRLQNIAKSLLARIDELLAQTSSDSEMDSAIRQQEHKLKKINNNIDNLVEDIQMEIEELNRIISRKFEDNISAKLDSIVANRSSNFDAEAVSIINSTTALYVAEMKSSLRDLFRQKAEERQNTEAAVDLASLSDIDTSQFAISGISYNLDLNTMGHEYDGMIATGITVIATAAVAYAGYAAAGVATAADMADTMSDVMCDGDKAVSSVVKSSTSKQGGGIIQSVVGYFTDEAMAKPQRRRAIANFLDAELLPKFNGELNDFTIQTLATIKKHLHEEAASTIEEMKALLQTMIEQRHESKVQFENRKNQLLQYRTELLNINK